MHNTRVVTCQTNTAHDLAYFNLNEICVMYLEPIGNESVQTFTTLVSVVLGYIVI